MQNSGIPSNSLPVPEGFGKSGLNLSDAEVICSGWATLANAKMATTGQEFDDHMEGKAVA